MEGRHPGTGSWLRPEGAGGGRGGGIDATFSAPEVRLDRVGARRSLAARADRGGTCKGRRAAPSRYLREQVPVVRRRYGGEVVEERAKDVIATEYRHTTARGVSGAQAPDPQLHSHVVITGAIREDDRLVAVASRPIFRAARELDASTAPRSRKELVREGYTIERNTGKDGRYFEIAGVPRSLLRGFLRAYPRGRQSRGAISRQTRSRSRTGRAARPRAREPPSEGADDPRRPPASLERDRQTPSVRTRSGCETDRRARAHTGRADGRGPDRSRS